MSLTTVLEKLGKLIDKEKNAEVYGIIADLRMEIAKLQEEIVDLKRKNLDLKQRLQSEEELELRFGLYWLKSDSDRDHPFCPVCWGKEKARIVMHIVGTKNPVWRCSSCKNSFKRHT